MIVFFRRDRTSRTAKPADPLNLRDVPAGRTRPPSAPVATNRAYGAETCHQQDRSPLAGPIHLIAAVVAHDRLPVSAPSVSTGRISLSSLSARKGSLRLARSREHRPAFRVPHALA